MKLYHPFFINPSRYDLQMKNLGEENAITTIELYQVGPGGTKSLINAPTVIDPGLEKGEHAGISFLLYNRVPKIEVDIIWKKKSVSNSAPKLRESFIFKM